MSIAVAQTRHIFGLKAGVAGNIAYHDEQTIVYPVGANCVMYNIDLKSQKFIPGSDKTQVGPYCRCPSGYCGAFFFSFLLLIVDIRPA